MEETEKKRPDIMAITFGDILKEPTQDAIDGINFDLNDGLRVLMSKGARSYQPVDHRYAGLHRGAAHIFGVDDSDIFSRFALRAPLQIKEEYVCIRVQSTSVKFFSQHRFTRAFPQLFATSLISGSTVATNSLKCKKAARFLPPPCFSCVIVPGNQTASAVHSRLLGYFS